MMSKAHFDRVTGYLERAEAAGVRAAVGGGPRCGLPASRRARSPSAPPSPR